MQLTESESIVMTYMAWGYRYTEIARIKNLSWRTIKHHAYRAQAKLGARTMFEAVALFAMGEDRRMAELPLPGTILELVGREVRVTRRN